MEGSLEVGRGPLFRRLGALPHLAALCLLSAVCLAAPDPQVRRALEQAGVPYTVHHAHLDGWRVIDLDAVVAGILADATAWGADLVVLDWELWDLMRELSGSVPALGARFAAVVHAVPFLNTPAYPGVDFEADVGRRLEREPDPAIKAYIADNARDTRPVLRRMDLLVPNQCVIDYLAHYMPGVSPRLMEPGYAIDLAEIDATVANGPPLTFAFMARLVAEKGLYDVLRIFARICEHPGFGSARLLLMGSFEDGAERTRFLSAAARLGVAHRIEPVGWQVGAAKYRLLRRARVFLYPAAESDTFSICMLEALACGLPVVCADVPFSRSVYRTDAVVRCAPDDVDAFALEAMRLAATDDWAHRARAFAQSYGSWNAVAEAEASAYRAVLDASPGGPSRSTTKGDQVQPVGLSSVSPPR